MGKKTASGNNDMTAILNQLQKTYSVDNENDIFESESVYEDTELSDLLAKIISEKTPDDNCDSDEDEVLDLGEDIPSESKRKTKKSKKTSGAADVSTDIQNIIMSEEYMSVLKDCEANLEDIEDDQVSEPMLEMADEEPVDQIANIEIEKTMDAPVEKFVDDLMDEPANEIAQDLAENATDGEQDIPEEPLPWDEIQEEVPLVNEIESENIDQEAADIHDDLTFVGLDHEETEADNLTFGDLDDEEIEEDNLTFGDLDDEETEADDLTFGDLNDEETQADDLTFGDLDNQEVQDNISEIADEPTYASETTSPVIEAEKKLYYTVLEEMDLKDAVESLEDSVEPQEQIEAIEETDAPEDSNKAQEDVYIVLSKESYTDDPLQWHLDVAQVITVNNDSDEETQEPTKKATEFHDDDISLLLQLGYKDELNTEVGHERTDSVVHNIKNSYRPDKNKIPFGFCGKEFFESSQIEKIKQKYDYDKRNIIIKIALFSCISLVLMLLGIIFKGYSSISSFVMFSVMELLIISLGCVVIYKELLAGIRGIFKFSPTIFTMPMISLLVLVAFDIFNIAVGIFNPEMISTSSASLFGFTTSIFFIFALVAQLINCVREQKTFKLICASEDLYTAETLISQKKDSHDANNLRTHEIRKQVKGNAVCVKKTKYISEYFKRSSESSYGIGNVILALGVVPLAAMILACIIIATGRSAADVASTIVFAFYMCLSVSFLLIMPVTLFAASQSLAHKKCGIIGTGAISEYAQTNSIIFPDTVSFEIGGDIDVIPFGDTDVNASMKTASRLFTALGGTLSDVIKENPFSKDKSISQADINIAFINDDGVELFMDGETHILLGNKEFISDNRKRLNFEACDLIPSAVSAGREVVYLAINGEVSLGYIMSLGVKEGFVDKVMLLAQHNIKTYVSTYEPHIKTARYNGSKIGVYRPYEHEAPHRPKSRYGGIVASGDARNITYPLIMTSEILKSVRKSAKISLLFILAGIVISFVITLVGYLAPNALGLLRHRDIFAFVIQLISAIPLTVSAIKLWKKYK